MAFSLTGSNLTFAAIILFAIAAVFGVGALALFRAGRESSLISILGDWSIGLDRPDESTPPEPVTYDAIDLSAPLPIRLSQAVVGPLIPWLTRATPGNYAESLQRRLDQAGNPWGLAADGFVILQVGACIGGGIVGFLIAALGLIGSGGVVSIGQLTIIGGLLGFFAPMIYLRDIRMRRQKALRQALPNWLDIIAITVRAGSSFDAAVVRMSAKSSGPLIEEFDKYLRERQLGMSTKEALQHVQDRNDAPELSALISSGPPWQTFCESKQKTNASRNDSSPKKRPRKPR